MHLYFNRLAHTYGLSEAAFLYMTHDVIKKLCKHIDSFIQFPKQEDLEDISGQFNRMTDPDFPGVIGALDSCHIPIEPIKDEWHTCYNYKHYHSVHLQAITGPDLRFYDIYVGSVGKQHDSRVFADSPISELLPQYLTVIGLPLVKSYHIISDAAYRLQRHIMTPYKKIAGNLTRSQMEFNRKLSSKRQLS